MEIIIAMNTQAQMLLELLRHYQYTTSSYLDINLEVKIQD